MARCVHDDEIRRTVRILKDPGQSLGGQRISIPLVGRRWIGQRNTKKRILVGSRIAAALHGPLPARAKAVTGTAVGGGALGVGYMKGVRVAPGNQVDDGGELRVEQDGKRSVAIRGADGRAGDVRRARNARHAGSVTGAPSVLRSPRGDTT